MSEFSAEKGVEPLTATQRRFLGFVSTHVRAVVDETPDSCLREGAYWLDSNLCPVDMGRVVVSEHSMRKDGEETVVSSSVSYQKEKGGNPWLEVELDLTGEFTPPGPDGSNTFFAHDGHGEVIQGMNDAEAADLLDRLERLEEIGFLRLIA